MAALTGNVARRITPSGGALCVMRVPVKASAVIYKGAALELSGGFARICTQSSTNGFLGFADHDALGGASDGLNFVDVIVEGVLQVAAITGSAAITDVGDTVYAINDNDLTETSTNNIAIGRIISYDASNGFGVFFQAAVLRSI